MSVKYRLNGEVVEIKGAEAYTGFLDKNDNEIFEGDIVGYVEVDEIVDIPRSTTSRKEFNEWFKASGHADLTINSETPETEREYESALKKHFRQEKLRLARVAKLNPDTGEFSILEVSVNDYDNLYIKQGWSEEDTLAYISKYELEIQGHISEVLDGTEN